MGRDKLHIVTVFQELVSHKINIFEFSCSVLPLFYFLCRLKNHHCIGLYIRKVLKNGKGSVAHRYSLRRVRFAKYRFSNVHILHFRCFIPCLGYRTEESDGCDTLYAYFTTCLSISFRFFSQKKVSRL